MKKILVTGAAGLIGANFSRHLLAKGHRVFGVDNLSGGNIEYVAKHNNFVFMHCNVGHKESVLDLVESGTVDYVYHFAAMAAAGLSPFIRTQNYQDNIIQPSKLINACINGGVKKLIFTSSMEVYGSAPSPFFEDDILKAIPETPYGIAKRAIELDLESAYKYHGLDYAIVRPHNVHGIYQNIWDKYRNVIGIFIRQAIAGEPLTVYGDGLQQRAYSDIKYYMEPLEKLMSIHSRTDYGKPPIWNIGADNPSTIIDLVTSVTKAAKENGLKPVQVKHLEERTEVKEAWCNHDKAKSELGFIDETNLDTLVSDMMKWAITQKQKEVKVVNFEVTKNLYEYWKP